MTAARNRGRSNGNESGNSTQRRQRKQKLIDRDGDGVKAPCWECDAIVTVTTIFVDRIVAGVDGGTYDLDNCRVHCQTCSGRQGQRMTQLAIARMKAFREEQTRGRGVKFKTADLRRATDSAIAEYEIQHNRRQNTKRAEYDLKKSRWVEDYNVEWERALPRIRKAIRAGQPVTIDELAVKRDSWRDSVAVFGKGDAPKDEPFVIPQDLRVIRNALRLITDEDITTTALKTLGVNASMLRMVCDYARDDLVKQQAKEKATAPKAAPVKAPARRRTPAKSAGPRTQNVTAIIPQETS